jgi:hypothetical protein
MHPDIIADVIKGQGHAVLKIPFNDMCTKFPGLIIDGVAELTAVVENFAHNLRDIDWSDLFQYAIIGKHGHPLTYEFAENLDKVPTRFIHTIKRPVQPGSTKTLVNDTPESKICCLGDALTECLFGSLYKMDKVSVILSEPLADRQVKHTDYKPHGVKTIDTETDFGCTIAIRHTASMRGYNYSQHIVQANFEAEMEGVAENQRLASVREKLKLNANFKIDINECNQTVIYYGTNEVFVFGDNYVHGGDENYSMFETLRLHFYIVRIGYTSLNNKTVVLDKLVWELTRGLTPDSQEKRFDFETYQQYADYQKKRAANKLAASKLAGILYYIMFCNYHTYIVCLFSD